MEVQQGSKSFSKIHPKNPTSPIDLQKNDDQQQFDDDIQHTFVPGNIQVQNQMEAHKGSQSYSQIHP